LTLTKPTLLILSLGELSTALLESVARADLFSKIVVGSRSRMKALQRANNAIIGAGVEGYYPMIEAEEFDIDQPSFVHNLRRVNPDIIFTAPSLMPWWKLDGSNKPALPFAGYMSMHLSLMAKFRDRIGEANTEALWIGASYPDVINPVLNRSGFGPDCGIGNVQEPIPKLKAGLARHLGCAPQAVSIHLAAQHAFEYYVLNQDAGQVLPPYLLKATVNGQDHTALAKRVLREPFPFPYDLHFNRVTASAGLVALRALTSPTDIDIHLPGIKGLVGGYPVTVNRSKIEIALPKEWSLKQAVDVNTQSLKWDGIELIENDGTVVFTEETQRAFYKLLGKSFERLNMSNVDAQANEILAAH
jgi:hypothetical protein